MDIWSVLFQIILMSRPGNRALFALGLWFLEEINGLMLIFKKQKYLYIITKNKLCYLIYLLYVIIFWLVQVPIVEFGFSSVCKSLIFKFNESTLRHMHLHLIANLSLGDSLSSIP